jgi:hypothetical protein
VLFDKNVLLFPALAQATAWQAGQQSKNKKIKKNQNKC